MEKLDFVSKLLLQTCDRPRCISEILDLIDNEVSRQATEVYLKRLVARNLMIRTKSNEKVWRYRKA